MRIAAKVAGYPRCDFWDALRKSNLLQVRVQRQSKRVYRAKTWRKTCKTVVFCSCCCRARGPFSQLFTDCNILQYFNVSKQHQHKQTFHRSSCLGDGAQRNITPLTGKMLFCVYASVARDFSAQRRLWQALQFGPAVAHRSHVEEDAANHNGRRQAGHDLSGLDRKWVDPVTFDHQMLESDGRNVKNTPEITGDFFLRSSWSTNKVDCLDMSGAMWEPLGALWFPPAWLSTHLSQKLSSWRHGRTYGRPRAWETYADDPW